MAPLRHSHRGWLLVVVFAIGGFTPGAAQDSPVRIEHKPGEARYEIFIAGRFFTAYRHGERFHDKPIFFPVLSPRGAPVTRSFPMREGVAGENPDHPHHESMWFTYGDVNGIDFWGPERGGRRIAHREATVEGDALRLTLDWLDREGEPLLEETRSVTFGGGAGAVWMDHDITLRALDRPVVFGDTKEGAFGLRVAASLRESDRTGSYVNAEGLESSGEVWGEPSAWVALRGVALGEAGEEAVTIAIFDHPESFNHPPRWHARDYGLFVANPFGRRGYRADLEPMRTELEPGRSLRLHYRIAIYEGRLGRERLAELYTEFAGGDKE